jgi:hypothetical protein
MIQDREILYSELLILKMMIYQNNLVTKVILKTSSLSIFEYIESWYNRKRITSGLGILLHRSVKIFKGGS